MRIGLGAVCAGLMLSACAGSTATLAIPPDFEMMTPAGISSVSVRRPPPAMTDADFERLVAAGMLSATPGSQMNGPMATPSPTRRIVWHASSMAPRGVFRLVVNVFDGSVRFAYEEQVVDNSAPSNVLESAIASLTRRLLVAIDQHDSRALARAKGSGEPIAASQRRAGDGELA